jgi:hypothetical protein
VERQITSFSDELTLVFMDKILRKFRDDAKTALGSNLICLVHHGSRAKCEAHAESDYDSIIIVKKLDAETIKTVQNLLQSNPGFTSYLLSLHDIKSLPKGHLLEFVYAKPLYGKLKMKTPTSEEVTQYLSHSRRDELFSIRHYLTLPHPPEKKAKTVYYWLKFVYVYLSYLAFIEAGRLPPTRKQTIAYFENRKEFSHGVKLLRILDNWARYKASVAKNPDHYLFTLEKFFRDASP